MGRLKKENENKEKRKEGKERNRNEFRTRLEGSDQIEMNDCVLCARYLMVNRVETDKLREQSLCSGKSNNILARSHRADWVRLDFV